MKTKLYKLAKWAAIAAVVLLGLHVILLLGSGLILRSRYAELRKAGRPMTAEELIPARAPDADNGAMLYSSAILLLKSEKSGDGNLLDDLKSTSVEFLSGTNDAASRARLGALLKRDTVGRALQLVDQAAARPACRFDVEYDRGAEVLLPHINGLLALGRALPAVACFQAESGDSDRAWETMATALRIADALRTDPILISQLVRIVQAHTAASAMQAVASVGVPSPEQARELDRLLAALDDRRPMVLAMDGERIFMGEWGFKQVEKIGKEVFSVCGEGPRWWDPLALAVLSYRPYMQVDHAMYLGIMKRMAEAVEGPWYAPAVQALGDRPEPVSRWFLLSSLLLPALKTVPDRQGMMQADVRVARVALALMLHKQAHTAYPEDLTGIDPALLASAPEDPFTGKPLIYRRDGDGFVLYSLGPNATDDGGRPMPKVTGTDGDVAWRSAR